MSLVVVHTVRELRDVVAAWRREGASIGVVPTMGALHEGHLGLVRAAVAKADRTIVTIFINPKQFNNIPDLTNYPRNDKVDLEKISSSEAHLLYAPDVAQIYPEGFATAISVGGISKELCGSNRPGHFDGVATVVTKLFLQTGADFAFFGEKDFQQIFVVRRLARDLDIPIEIIACPTVREPDGLAMSSRNSRLSSKERGLAPRLASILFETAERLAAGSSMKETLAQAVECILAAGFHDVEYLELRTEKDLQPLTSLNQQARLLVAAWLGEIRLIDNVNVPLYERHA